MIYRISLILILNFLLVSFSSGANAQHSHGRRNTIELEHDSIPAHDEVLQDAPTDMILRFNDYVRLVKWTLKAEDLRNVEIDFKFSNEYNKVFIQDLPQLEHAAYYTAEWAALDANNVIVYGLFCFSFGPNALTPTTIINSRVFSSDPVQR